MLVMGSCVSVVPLTCFVLCFGFFVLCFGFFGPFIPLPPLVWLMPALVLSPGRGHPLNPCPLAASSLDAVRKASWNYPKPECVWNKCGDGEGPPWNAM